MNCISRHFIILLVTGFSLFLFTEAQGQNPVMEKLRGIVPVFPAEAIAGYNPIEGEIVRQGLFAHSRPIREPGSPQGEKYAGTLDGNLYIRNKDSDVRQIIAKADNGWRWDVEGAKWSPNGNLLAVKQIDDREVPRISITKFEHGEEQESMIPYTRAGEPVEKHQVYVVDVNSGKTVAVDHGSNDPYLHIQGWSADNEDLRLFRTDRLMKKLDILTANAATGAVEKVLTETSETYILGLPLLQGYADYLDYLSPLHSLDQRDQFIWTSERSGFNHLYLYTSNGEIIRPLTEGKLNGLVHRIVEVDNRRGQVYFTASANKEDPYLEQLYRIDLDGEELQKIAEAPVLSEVRFSSFMDSIWVLREGLPHLFQIDLYTPDGSHQKTSWSPDLSFIRESGFAPEFVKAKSADGETMIEVLVLKPFDFDPEKKYAVIESIYGGPNEMHIPRQLQSPPLWMNQMLANQGFVVLMTDGRGTPGRGKIFQDYSFSRFGQVELEDHVAVLNQLGKERPYMDLSRIGIMGHSWGGYFALRALLKHPDLYRAAHITAPAVDPFTNRVAVEAYMGCLPEDCPESYQKGANTEIVKNLSGPLMIVHGTADDDVPLEESEKLLKAFSMAGKENIEFKKYPGVDHIVMRSPQWGPEMLGFFKKHLKGQE